MLGLVKCKKETGEFWTYVLQQCLELDSPIIQIFPNPFTKPWVIVCGAQEMHDVFVRRTKELDRADLVIRMFAAIVPNEQISLKTGEHRRHNRRLIGETMGSKFLGSVARWH